MNDQTAVAVVMPAFNEADGIAHFLNEIDEKFSHANIPFVVLIQDDQSTDETPDLLRGLTLASGSPIIVEINGINLGHGPTSRRALQRGLDSGAPWVLHVDGDGQFSGTDLVSVVRHGFSSNRSVVGRRTIRHDPWFRKILTRCLRVLFVVTTRSFAIKDPNSPVRIEKRDVLRSKLEKIPADTLIPSIWWSWLTAKKYEDVQYVDVTSWHRRGISETGTMWGKAKRPRLPSRRLIRFVLAASRETLRMRQS